MVSYPELDWYKGTDSYGSPEMVTYMKVSLLRCC